MNPYNSDHSELSIESSLRSAKEIVPFIVEMLHPTSIVDIGCATGAWLSVFANLGAEKILGVDGDYVNTNHLKIPESVFLVHNLEQPLELTQEFDLVLSLEVAEHISAKNAESFVNTLTNLGPAILFSAALPYQPGDTHINCQWPDYWATFFYKKGYVLFDCLRMKFWQNENVDWWYSQNMLLFLRQSSLSDYPKLTKSFSYSNRPPASIIHPKLYLMHLEKDDRRFKSKLVESLKQKLGRPFRKKSILGSSA